jgi:hypothetical protein
MNPCPNCRSRLAENTDACPHCGRLNTDLREARLEEAERLERAVRLCAIVMPLAALAAFCFTSIPGTFLPAVEVLGKDIASGSVQVLGALFYTLLILAFFTMPIIAVVFIGRAVLRCFQNR